MTLLISSSDSGPPDFDLCSLQTLVRNFETALSPFADEIDQSVILRNGFRDLKSAIREYGKSTTDFRVISSDFWARWRNFSSTIIPLFQSQIDFTAEMTSIHNFIQLALHNVHKYQRQNQTRRFGSLDSKLQGMVDMFAEGSVRHLIQAGTAILEVMQTSLFETDPSLNLCKQKVCDAVNSLNQLFARALRERKVPQLFQEAEQLLEQCLPRPRRRAKVTPLNICRLTNSEVMAMELRRQSPQQFCIGELVYWEPLIEEKRDDESDSSDSWEEAERCSRVKVENLELKSRLGSARKAIQALREQVFVGAREIEAERFVIQESQDERRRQQQVELVEKIRGQLATKQEEVHQAFAMARQQASRLEELRGQLADVRNSQRKAVEDVTEDVRFHQRLTRGLRTDEDFDEMFAVLDAQLDRFRPEQMRFKLDPSQRLQELDILLRDLNQSVDRLTFSRSKLEEEANLNGMGLDYLGGLASLANSGDLFKFLGTRVARLGLESARLDKAKQSAKERKQKVVKLRTKLRKKIPPKMYYAMLPPELECLRQQGEKLHGELEQALPTLQAANEQLSTARQQRDGLRNTLGCLGHTLRVSEVFEELTVESTISAQFLTDCMLRATAMQISFGRTPANDETLANKLEILGEEITRMLEEVYADPEAEKADSLRIEIDQLKQENKRLQAAVNSILKRI
jgi:hypothetical protein